MANDKKESKAGRGRRFFKEVAGEVKKLSWPSKKELISYTITVVAFILLLGAMIYVLDLAFGSGLGLLAKL
ncbi:MAG: preprotein translocase subunit SecE [Christensenellaceae bacterium]|jgi:preprotein translocase subunit SecE|nr:preprotein translocase subunit SecE [Christensenellaceae bacterium]